MKHTGKTVSRILLLATVTSAILVTAAFSAEMAGEITEFPSQSNTCEPDSSRKWALGLAGAVAFSPYKSYDTKIIAVPLITYDGDRVYVRGAEVGVNILKNEHHMLAVNAMLNSMEFDPDDTDAKELKELDKRRQTLMAGVSYSFIGKFGILQAQVSQDVLGKSNGTLGDLLFSIPWITEKFSFMPGIGVQLSGSKYNEYYYGVSHKEADRSGLKYHKPGNAISPYISVGMKYKITERWEAVASGKMEYLTGSVKDSPMVGKKYSATVGMGIQYKF